MNETKNAQGAPQVTRRGFLAGAAAFTAAAAAVPASREPLERAVSRVFHDEPHGVGTATDAYGPQDVIYTVCQQCQTFCTIKVVLRPGEGTGATALVRKIAGNPYSPLTTQPEGPIPYDTPPALAVQGLGSLTRDGRSRRGGRTCLKGQAGIQIVHDARRVTQPLKRVGPRGSGRWQTISWEQALKEILDGAPDLGTPGIRSWWAYAPQEPVMADWEKVRKGEMTQAEFEARWGDKLIDPRHPDLGPRANLLAVMAGDRGNLVVDRFARQGLGTVNTFNHGGVCGIQGVVANNRSHAGKQHPRMYADLDHCEYLIVWGTEPLTANKGPTWLAPRLTNALQRGMKLVVVDPRLSKTAEKAHRWVPILPGGDAALALGMARWIIENRRYDEKYLRCPGPAAAKAAGEPTWSDATHLVNLSDPKRPKLRMKDLGLEGDQFVVLVDGRPAPHDTAGPADLEVDTELAGPKGPIRVKSVFTLLRERVQEKTLAEYAELAGVSEDLIATLAREFTSYGKRAVVMSYRGPAMHTNGYYNVRAINVLNFLIGNHDWKGGEISAGARYAELKGRYDLTTVPGGLKPWGIPITREKSVYEKSTLFQRDGYPAKRRWYPFPANLVHEVLPSAKAAYPYALKALFIQRHSPVDSSPGGIRQAEILKDPNAVGLVVAFDVEIGDTSRFADYILPDVTYLERWGLESIYPNQPYKVSLLGQPVTRAFDGPRPAEQFWIDLLKAMGLPGVGPGAFPDGSPLDTPEDFYLKVAANIAYDGTPVPDASDEELRLFAEARRRALGPSWDEAAWRRAVKPEEWRKVVYVLNRGGRFEGPGREYEGEWIRYRFGAQCSLYDEGAAAVRDSITGEFWDGLPRVEPVRFADGRPVDDALPLVLINWKARQHGTHRTVAAAWLREVRPENHLWMNPADAAARGIRTGDRVRVRSASAAVEARVWVTEGIRPGVVGADFSYGHVGYGAEAVEIDGKRHEPVRGYGHTPYDLAPPLHEEAGLAGGRGTGFLVNSLLRDDVVTGGGGLTDPIGGGASQLDTRVEVERIV
ncbi:molybdopterin-dependent oxidoreductase [Caldinitratiruptor microaerophilus]|uniref:Molybdopterin oxidoreductase n=1 Tax=Caldinitratiruptor microaerophilus TaxID=671077 RepID=A0AA35G947_9FIRM|nr:molybdopterin-dependent oxidoreductase [Caldinitratiruptor microaerophilus]BDG61068.1 molybdopterin oxidoreductase [Caldinitratiruptor microaerophilus]